MFFTLYTDFAKDFDTIFFFTTHSWNCAHIANIKLYMALCLTHLFCCCSIVPRVHTLFTYYFTADINLNSADTHWLIKLTDLEFFYCLYVLLCVLAPVCSSPCLLQEFMGWCHRYAGLPSRALRNSHLKFYAVWQSPGRGHQGHGKTTSFMALTVLRRCHDAPGTVLLFSWCSRNSIKKYWF